MVTARIILNIREAASRRFDDISFVLHLSDIGSRVPRSRLSFAEGPAAVHLEVDDCESGTFELRGRVDNASVVRTGVVSISNSTMVSHCEPGPTLTGSRADPDPCIL